MFDAQALDSTSLPSKMPTHKDLDELSEVIARGESSECELRVLAIQSEVRARLDQNPTESQDWFRHLARVLVNKDVTVAAPQRIDTLILLAWWFEEAEQRAYGIHLLRGAIEIADATGALSSKRRVLNSLGGLYNRAKNAAESTVSFVESLELAEKLGDRVGRCAAIANIASLRLNIGMADDAIKLSQLVIALCGGEGIMRPLRAQALHSLAEAHLLLSDPATARQYAERALADSPETRSHFDSVRRVLMETTLVRSLVLLGEIDGAEAHAAVALEFANKASAHTTTIQSQISLALCEAARGNTDIAMTRLAGIEPLLSRSDVSFRDFIEAELFANEKAGRRQYADYYKKKYLSSVAEFQRKCANAQVAELKAHLAHERKLQPVTGKRRASRKRLADVVQTFIARMDGLATLAELREDASGEHSYRVGILSRLLAVAAGYNKEEAEIVEQAARLHDLGKLATPDSILLKPGKLSDAEVEIMRRHSTEGSQILTDLLYTVEASQIAGAPEIAEVLRVAAEVAHSHHEWWDGSGYPRAIAGNAIPRAAQIVSLADVFDELTHERPYKDACSNAMAITQIAERAGTQFAPDLCIKFVEVVRGLAEMPRRAESTLSPFAAANQVIKKIVAQQPLVYSDTSSRAESQL